MAILAAATISGFGLSGFFNGLAGSSLTAKVDFVEHASVWAVSSLPVAFTLYCYVSAQVRGTRDLRFLPGFAASGSRFIIANAAGHWIFRRGRKLSPKSRDIPFRKGGKGAEFDHRAIGFNRATFGRRWICRSDHFLAVLLAGLISAIIIVHMLPVAAWPSKNIIE